MNASTKNIKLSTLATAFLAAGLVMSTGAFAGGTTPLTVNARISGTCKVTVPPTTLDFGTIDPSGAANALASTTFTMMCTNGTLAVAPTDGGVTGGIHNAGGSKRMQHSVNLAAFLPYAIAYAGTPFTGTGFGGTATTVTINGTITPADYNNAIAATGGVVYADTVTINLLP